MMNVVNLDFINRIIRINFHYTDTDSETDYLMNITLMMTVTMILILITMILLKMVTIIHIFHNCMLIYVFIVHAFTSHRLVHFKSFLPYLFH